MTMNDTLPALVKTKMPANFTGQQYPFLSEPGGSSAEEEEEERRVLLLWLQRSWVFCGSQRQAPLCVLGFLQQVEISKQYCALNENAFQNKAKLEILSTKSLKKMAREKAPAKAVIFLTAT